MDTSSPSPKKIEILVISKDKYDEIKGRMLTEKEIEDLLKKNQFNLVQKDA